jgi:hypothetical protein
MIDFTRKNLCFTGAADAFLATVFRRNPLPEQTAQNGFIFSDGYGFAAAGKLYTEFVILRGGGDRLGMEALDVPVTIT